MRHNTVYYPSLTIKGAIQSIRVARPLAADRTLIESWTFRLKGAPDKLLERTVMYNRLINSPMSVVGHDDLHCYRSSRRASRPRATNGSACTANFDAAEIERRRADRQRHERDLDAQPVPRLAGVHGAMTDEPSSSSSSCREARLMDEKRFDEWYELFTDDAHYWVPLAPGQTDPLSHNSLAYEDKLLLKLRIERLKQPDRVFAEAARAAACTSCRRPRWRSRTHARGEYLMRTPFIYTETRGDESQRYAATAWHTLVRSGQGSENQAEARRHPERRRRPALDPAFPVSAARHRWQRGNRAGGRAASCSSRAMRWSRSI